MSPVLQGFPLLASKVDADPRPAPPSVISDVVGITKRCKMSRTILQPKIFRVCVCVCVCVCGEWGISGQNSGILIIVTSIAIITVKGEVTVTFVM